MLLSAPQTDVRAEVEWQIAPYLWAADVGADVTINNDPVLGTTVPFSDLVDKLDSALMLHVEGRGSESDIGGFFDLISMDLSDSNIIPVGPGGPILGDLVTTAALSMSLYEGAVTFRFGDLDIDRFVLDIFGGIRYVDVDIDARITLPGPAGTVINRSIAVSELDGLMGVRAIGKMSDRWHYRLRGDYSAFGTEGTVNLLATIGYTFGQTGLFSMDFGYRYLTMELADNLSNGATSSSDISFSGPAVGFVFSF
jgi:hypothetical protein